MALCGNAAAGVVAVLAAFAAGCGLFDRGVGDVPPLSGGIQVNEPDHQVWVEALQGAGLDAVQVTLYARQQDWRSTDMILPDGADSVVAEIRAAKAAGLRVVMVLRVALEQGLVENRHYWHGMIWPADEEVEAWFAAYRRFARWGAEIAARESVDLLAIGSELNSLASTTPVSATPPLYDYFLDPERTSSVRRRLVDCAASVPPEDLAGELTFVDGGGYATLDGYLRAQEDADRAWAQHVAGAATGADVDVEALSRRRQRLDGSWRALIADLRAVYPGPMSYAANFDQAEEVGFWDALDAVGVNAYYPLSRWGLSGDRLDEALTAGWEGVAAGLNDLANRNGGPGRVLPVLLFELGWTRKAGSTVRPFSYNRVEALETAAADGGAAPLTCVHWASQPEEPFERVRALAALDRVVAQGAFPTLRGFMLWKLSTRPEHRDIEPFVVILPQPGARLRAADAAADAADRADRQFLAIARRLAGRLSAAAPARR